MWYAQLDLELKAVVGSKVVYQGTPGKIHKLLK